MDFKIEVKCKNCRFGEQSKYKVCYCNVNKHIVDAYEPRKCKAYIGKNEKIE